MQCLTPFGKIDKFTGESMDFPCGKCYVCLRRRVSGWSFRIVKEGLRCNSSFFVTFTYDTNHVPISNNGFMSLDKTDYQKFVKRLRKIHNGEKIRYFACGEYGDETMRPHYHAIMYNVDILQVEKCWNQGAIHVGDVTGASIGYCLKYMMKKNKIPLHRNDDRKKEFQLMSKGLGENYLTENMRAWHHADMLNRFYCAIEEGKKIAMPRYYKQKLYSEIELRQIGKYLSTTVEKENLTGIEEINKFEYFAQKLKNSRLITSL